MKNISKEFSFNTVLCKKYSYCGHIFTLRVIDSVNKIESTEWECWHMISLCSLWVPVKIFETLSYIHVSLNHCSQLSIVKMNVNQIKKLAFLGQWKKISYCNTPSSQFQIEFIIISPFSGLSHEHLNPSTPSILCQVLVEFGIEVLEKMLKIWKAHLEMTSKQMKDNRSE